MQWLPTQLTILYEVYKKVVEKFWKEVNRSKAMAEGELAAMMGYSQDENPSPVGTQENEDWDEGWWFCDDYGDL
jgi:hypothetical protein